MISAAAEARLDGPGDRGYVFDGDIPIFTGTVPKDEGDAGAAHLDDITPLVERTASYSGLSRKHRDEAKHIVAVYARLLLTEPGNVHYTQGSDRWSGILKRQHQSDIFPFKGDCSSTYTFIDWRALEHVHPGITDIINGAHWLGGYTGTIAAHGKTVHHDENLQIGDALLYGPAPTYEHVTTYLGGGVCFSHGSEGGPYPLDIDYRPDRHLAKRFF